MAFQLHVSGNNFRFHELSRVLWEDHKNGINLTAVTLLPKLPPGQSVEKRSMMQLKEFEPAVSRFQSKPINTGHLKWLSYIYLCVSVTKFYFLRFYSLLLCLFMSWYLSRWKCAFSTPFSFFLHHLLFPFLPTLIFEQKKEPQNLLLKCCLPSCLFLSSCPFLA